MCTKRCDNGGGRKKEKRKKSCDIRGKRDYDVVAVRDKGPANLGLREPEGGDCRYGRKRFEEV